MYEKAIELNPEYAAPYYNLGCTAALHDNLTEALTLEANALIEQSVGEGTPFFLYMAHYAVHSPFHPDPRFIGHYADSDKPEKAKAFASMIEGMDKSLGDIMRKLDELKVAEDTLIMNFMTRAM